jgi:hypothetical protein
MLQGYSRYSLRETLHFGADFPGLDNSNCVGDARPPDKATIAAITGAPAEQAERSLGQLCDRNRPMI